MKITFALVLCALLCATALTACGQRVAPREPATKVHDSNSF